MTTPIALVSLSAAMDGSFTAIADVSAAMSASATTHQHRLIGGAAVMIHIQRLSLDVPLQATGNADFGMPPHVLREPQLVDAIEAMGYTKVAGNRWERPIDDHRVATVDLLIPTYRSRARDTVTVGSVITTEVPGLAEALWRSAVIVDIEVVLTDHSTLSTMVTAPDAVNMLALKASVLTARTETRDTEDMWRCLEVAAAGGVKPASLDSSESLRRVREVLWHELGPGGSA